MLAEIFFLKVEAVIRASDDEMTLAHKSRFVPPSLDRTIVDIVPTAKQRRRLVVPLSSTAR
jgi:hypothetical protein